MKPATERVLSALVVLGRRYLTDILFAERWDTERMKRDWYYAFKFFLSRIYFQGRNDSLSERYFGAMARCLDREFAENPTRRLTQLRQDRSIPISWTGFDRQTSALWLRFDASMGKERDREMVLDALRYVYELDDHNLVNHSLRAMQGGELRPHRKELRAIRQVGPKTSALYLRDLVFSFGCRVSPDDALSLQPVDTWVTQVVDAARGDTAHGDRISSGEWLMREAGDRLDPRLLNAGAWYLGKYSFPVLLSLLAAGEISPQALESVSLGTG